MRLHGKIALVTGSDSGIGRAIALTFAREGAGVVVHYYSDLAGALDTAERVRGHGSRAEVLQADLSDPYNARDLYQRTVELMGRVDVLVNSAGTGPRVHDSLEVPIEEFLRVINVDLTSPWVLCQAAANDMARRGNGVIINITSVHEVAPLVGGAPYHAAKGGLRNLTKSLALELASRGLRINNIAPGMVATPMTADALSDPVRALEATARIPMRRAADPQEIANVALFLASDDASYVTGHTFFADGGLLQIISVG